MASALFISNAAAQAQANALNVATTGFGEAVTLATITLPAHSSNTVTSGVITFGAIATVQGQLLE